MLPSLPRKAMLPSTVYKALVSLASEKSDKSFLNHSRVTFVILFPQDLFCQWMGYLSQPAASQSYQSP